jgi:hypothetical protein
MSFMSEEEREGERMRLREGKSDKGRGKET